MKKSIPAVLVVVVLGVVLARTAAAQDTLWTRVYGGSANDFIQSVRQTGDGGYIFCGGTESYGAGDWDVYILRTDADGDTLWTRTYGGTDREIATSIDRTSDGGFIIAGETASFGAGDQDIYLLKVDAGGDTLWARTYGGIDYERASRVIQASDGRYVICGRTSSFGAGDQDVYMVFVDSDGDTLGTRTYGGSQTDIGFALQETSEGGFVLGGVTASSGAGDYDYYLIKTDAEGIVDWEQTYGGSGMEWCHDAIQALDGGYIIVGTTYTWGHGGGDVYIVKTDSSGDTTWTRVYGDVHSDGANSVQQAAGGGFAVVGFSGDWEAGWGDIYMLRTDGLGDTLWTRMYSRGPWYNRETSGEMFIDLDGDIIVTGQTETNGTGLYDGYILKIEDCWQSGAGDDWGDEKGAADLLLSNSPNPFAAYTRVSFYVPASGRARLSVYNALGKRVAVLLDDRVTSGPHSALWDASALPPGIYFLRLVTERCVSVGSMTLVR